MLVYVVAAQLVGGTVDWTRRAVISPADSERARRHLPFNSPPPPPPPRLR